ncbi:ArAE-2 domain-containing protein [Mycena sanguinolenta]|uniref:ArAE-2 domain-containing protein n=1 Tax=Mycena sanguinolenta TaxID=230812 RepID=A0A8H6ZHZ9_9AGAR|nr:ArAE-2 domain-containing protein [Mycena sanguinolenta]
MSISHAINVSARDGDSSGFNLAESPEITPQGGSYKSVAERSLRPSLLARGRSASGSSFSFNRSTPTREHKWSVFGQLMENEAQLWTGGSIKSISTPRSNNNVVDAPDPFLDVGVVRAQSPTAESIEFFMNPPQNDVPGDEYDSDASDAGSTITHLTADQTPSNWWQRIPTVPVLYRNIIKCAVAYFIASLFTFSPYLSSFISDLTTYGDRERRPSPSGHMVATVMVYFNPAKTMGGMVEADLYCFVGLMYSAFVCLSSMSMFWWLETKPGWEWLADILVIVWIGVSMSIVAWMKVWMASPSFNTACSMTAIILFVVLVKEGGLQTLLQVSFIVLCGSAVSNLVCYAIWPQSATSALQANMTKTLDSFSTLLTLLTNAFLLEEGLQQPSHERLMKAVANHQSSFTSLKKSLKEAQSEWGQGNGGRLGQAYEDAVDSMTRLAQHLNGLRGGTNLQYDLTKAGVVGKSKKAAKANGNGKQKAGRVSVAVEDADEETVMLKAAAEMFGDLVDDLGPPLKALSTTCASSLQRMRQSFVKSQRRSNLLEQHEFLELVDGIERALVRFESTSNHAVLRLYRRSAAIEYSGDLRDSIYSENTEVLSGAENEHVFFEFAGELVSLVDAMGRIYSLEHARTNRPRWWTRIFRFCSRREKTTLRSGRRPAKEEPDGLRRRFSQYMIPAHRRTHPSFPKIRPHAPNTMQTPAWERLTWIGKLKQWLWTVGKRLTESDTKYAVKAGMATAILAAPAFFDTTRPYFVDLWGDWALISFFIVISPTIGATNYLSLHRVLGTILGAGVAAGVYTLFPEDAVVLSVFGFFFSIPCFYYIVAKPQYISASRFVLLTYNLTCLYCYNLRQKEVSPVDVAIKRAIAVTAGVVWAALVSRFWWPAEARRELSKALGEFCLNIGWLYTRLVASNSYATDSTEVTEEYEGLDSEVHALSPEKKLSNSIKEFMAMELHLQIKLIELQGLLAQTQHEPRLKGPFPVQLYRGVLTSLQTILDKLHSMRYTSVRQDFILPVNKERREMVGNIILSFSTLASAFRLKAPLPPYLPPAEASRQRLVAAIRKLDVVRNREVKGSRQLLFFAYALTMKGVTVELENIGHTLQNAFGVIGQTPASPLMDRNVFEEREIRDLIRQANANREKSGDLRLKALHKLIDLTRTQKTSLKILAAKNIPFLFSDFQDEEEAAINAVRKEGYNAITAISKVANKWVKRNTDVLLQLLQSDEPDEVIVVKQALIEHLDLDPRVTLGVLCDQLLPAETSMVDPDELYMRDRLRTLVLAFLTGEAKEAILERHALPKSEGEGVLIEGILAAIPILTPPDTDIVVKQLLLQLHSFRLGSSRSNVLLPVLVNKAKLCLKADVLQQRPSLATTRFYMELMAHIAVEKSIGSPMDLLRFYLPDLVSKGSLQRFSPSDQIFVICNMAEALAACEKDVNTSHPSQLSVLRNQSVEASPNLFECLARAGMANERSRSACRVILQSCLHRKGEGWKVPAHFRSPLETLRTKSEQFKDVQDLIRSLVSPAEASAKEVVESKLSAGTSPKPPPPGQRLMPGSSLRHSLPNREMPVVSTSGSNERVHAVNRNSYGADSSPRPVKRARTDSDEPPSLLSRLATKETDHRPNVARPGRAAQQKPVSAADTDNSIPRGGYSIKGAAKALNESPTPSKAPSSLLNRIIMDDDVRGGSGGVRTDSSLRRKYP